ncbi:9438_t:CDS:2 [Ambispora leptoticha]|uniref:9438_t:CDS:1 n=1 Tax=Ambispora leptoticha TaxID=144679 RepID=A0A9N9BSU8_9GLOM|nr:9438_t:CDS:2 [Ambispora leptoticha]
MLGSGLVEDENVAVRRMAEYLEIELAANNLHHIMRVVDNTNHLFTILDDIETMQRRWLRDPT